MLKKYAHQGCVQICEKSLGLSWMLKNKRRILCSAIIIIRHIATSYLMKICKDESYDPSPATTKVQGDRELPTISEHVLEKHQVKGFESKKKRMVLMYQNNQTKDFLSFWICNKDDSYDKRVVDGFLERIEDKKNLALLMSARKRQYLIVLRALIRSRRCGYSKGCF